MPDREPSIVSQSGRYKLTRSETGKRLGVSNSTVRRLEWIKLNPVADEHGVFRFDPNEVEALAQQMRDAKRERPRAQAPKKSAAQKAGLLAARTFKLFARHWSLPRIVAATKQPPERVRALYHEWVTSLEEGELNRVLQRRAPARADHSE